jgi:hypothetical protein
MLLQTIVIMNMIWITSSPGFVAVMEEGVTL